MEVSRTLQGVQTTIPQSLVDLVADWRALGMPDQPGILWPQADWCRDFPDYRDKLVQLPRLLDRGTVKSLSANAGRDPESAALAFVATMAWGFGNRGYGRYRVARILEATPDAAERLQAATITLNTDGALHAYALMSTSGDSHLEFLGPAFATKFLAFCSLDEARPALIFDRLVAAWLAKHMGGRWNASAWSASVYGRYLELVYGWASQIDARPDEIERLMFSDEARLLGNQWATE